MACTLQVGHAVSLVRDTWLALFTPFLSCSLRSALHRRGIRDWWAITLAIDDMMNEQEIAPNVSGASLPQPLFI